ncbi:unnamed protein product, partial [Mesorhabditis belari]|uniref:Uncharacterized protein n=1 Tax=Mesorhabditis belari TaxID=2138241 RepID=A0AAF3FKQ2_9BILA
MKESPDARGLDVSLEEVEEVEEEPVVEVAPARRRRRARGRGRASLSAGNSPEPKRRDEEEDEEEELVVEVAPARRRRRARGGSPVGGEEGEVMAAVGRGGGGGAGAARGGAGGGRGGGQPMARGGDSTSAARPATTSPPRVAGPRRPKRRSNEHDERLARIALILQFISLITEGREVNVWQRAKGCFFRAFGMEADATNLRRIATKMNRMREREKLMEMRETRNHRHYIANPFNGPLRIKTLGRQLNTTLVEHLTGWKAVCLVAKNLVTPLRLGLAEAIAFRTDQLLHCQGIVDNVVNDEETMDLVMEWFEDGAGLSLLRLIAEHTKMMRGGWVGGWEVGAADEGEESEGSSAAEEDVDSDDEQ